ncbi:MAG TPA: hypothetical protein VFS21_16200, partial [Roseiflexaceae bacterium]|nr:hypothetical protein [Roseiflexaceae bacterium]
MDTFPHKTLIPNRAAHLIARARLIELLHKITERQLITISAPAGYGKTSLLIEFAQNAPLPVCWYTLDPSDQDPWEFLEYFTAAINVRFPGSMKQTTALLEGHRRSELAWIITSFTQEIYANGQHLIVIIDDWHLVEHRSEINEIVSQLLRRCPNCHIILASRHYPSLPNITLLAARRQLLSINENHLRFTASETQELLLAEGLEMTDQKTEELTQKYNGWITGMLLLLQITDPEGTGQFSDVWAERQVYHYLAEQVFDLQTPELCDFLCESSLLDELTPDHCNTYLQRSDSRRMLSILHRHHLFVNEIDRSVLRYHPIFREFLQEHFSTIDPERYRALAQRIARIYADNGQWLLAFKLLMMIGERAAARD